MANTLVQFRTEEAVRIKAASICEKLGIDLPTYFRMCMSRLIQENGIPFSVKLDEVNAGMLETEKYALLEQYVEEVKKIYGVHLKSVILYGSYARGDFRPDSDIDIMILVDLPDMKVEEYWRQLSWSTYDFNEEHGMDIKPIAKSDAHFKKWLGVYPFYINIQKEGVELYGKHIKQNPDKSVKPDIDFRRK